MCTPREGGTTNLYPSRRGGQKRFCASVQLSPPPCCKKLTTPLWFLIHHATLIYQSHHLKAIVHKVDRIKYWNTIEVRWEMLKEGWETWDKGQKTLEEKFETLKEEWTT